MDQLWTATKYAVPASKQKSYSSIAILIIVSFTVFLLLQIRGIAGSEEIAGYKIRLDSE